jgi:hypothetical protein
MFIHVSNKTKSSIVNFLTSSEAELQRRNLVPGGSQNIAPWQA